MLGAQKNEGLPSELAGGSSEPERSRTAVRTAFRDRVAEERSDVLPSPALTERSVQISRTTLFQLR
jgi:hypothetical protein